MARPKRMIDPVSGIEREMADEENELLDLNDLDPRAIPQSSARVSKPFEGYPLKYAMVDGHKLCTTHMVLYNHMVKPLVNDPSNRKNQVQAHSRCIRDAELRENNIIVFDRKMKTKKGVFQFAIVRSDNLRAQLFFKYDEKAKRVSVDSRYLPVDHGQEKPLKRLFEMVINPKIRMERENEFITSEDGIDPGDPGEMLAEVSE